MIGLFFLSAFVSEVIGTIAGFGSSTVFLPLALFFFDFKNALVLVAFLHVFGNLGRVGFFRHGLDAKLLLRFGLPSVLFTLLGALLVTSLPQEVLKFCLGIFLAIYAAAMLWKRTLLFSATSANAVFGGSVSGFLAGLIGTGGALRGAFLIAFGLRKEKYIATTAAIALLVDLTRIPIYLRQGFLDERHFRYLPGLLAVALLGSFFGKRIVERIPRAALRTIVLVALLLIGLAFIYEFFR